MKSKAEAVERSMEPFRNARMLMAEELRHDEGLRLAYISNIAMLLYDRYYITDYDIRNKAAEDILNLIFGA